MIKVKQMEFSMFGVNTYIIWDVATKDAAVIDPAMETEAEQKEFDDFISKEGLHLKQIINTHLHLDHCFGENYVKDTYGVPVNAHVDDQLMGNMITSQYMMFGLKPKGTNITIDVPLHDGDIIHIGESELKVIHTPGHTPGGISLYDADDHLLFSGDTLFHGSVGRTDLPGGDHATLLRSVRDKLYSLPDNTLVLPGHNDFTTIGQEKASNPFTR